MVLEATMGLQHGSDLGRAAHQACQDVDQMGAEFQQGAARESRDLKSLLRRELCVDRATDQVDIAQPPLAHRFHGSVDSRIVTPHVAHLQK